MKIKKVKIKDNKLVMTYEKRNGKFVDEYSFTCSDLARPELYETLKALAEHVVDLCELPINYIPRITVKGVSYSYGGEDETMGATISAEMKLNESYAPLNLNTPHKTVAMYNANSEIDEKQLLSDDCIDVLKTLHKECEEYINGNRAQGRLFEVA